MLTTDHLKASEVPAYPFSLTCRFAEWFVFDLLINLLCNNYQLQRCWFDGGVLVASQAELVVIVYKR
ncbi:hypothetical protein A1OS_23230 [Enterovibrio norvegicus]|nr:hypothetical protein A1OS_23230 [Enterovibrio norvegicus]